MSPRPRIKAYFSVIPHSADIVEIRYGGWNAESYTLTDSSGSGLLFQVVGLIDGSRSVGEVARASGAGRKDVQAILDHLRDLGVLEEGPSSALDDYVARVSPTLLPFGGGAASEISSPVVLGSSDLASRTAELLRESLKPRAVTVDQLPDDPVVELAARSSQLLGDGFDLAEAAQPFSAWQARLVVLAEPVVRPQVAQILNRLSMIHGFAWLHAAVDGPSLVIGPLTTPHRSACYECFETRVMMNLRESASYQRYKVALATGRAAGTPPEVDPVLAAMVCAHTAAEALNYLLTGTSFTVGKALSIYLPTMEFTFNEVLRLPGCPACGPEPYAQDHELYFDVRSILGDG